MKTKETIEKIKKWQKLKEEISEELDFYFDDIILVTEIPEDAEGNARDGYYKDLSAYTEEMDILYVVI